METALLSRAISTITRERRSSLREPSSMRSLTRFGVPIAMLQCHSRKNLICSASFLCFAKREAKWACLRNGMRCLINSTHLTAVRARMRTIGAPKGSPGLVGARKKASDASQVRTNSKTICSASSGFHFSVCGLIKLSFGGLISLISNSVIAFASESCPRTENRYFLCFEADSNWIGFSVFVILSADALVFSYL